MTASGRQGWIMMDDDKTGGGEGAALMCFAARVRASASTPIAFSQCCLNATHRKQRWLMGMSRRRRKIPLHSCHTCRIHSGARARENAFIYHSYGGHLPSACMTQIVPRHIDTHWLDGSIQTIPLPGRRWLISMCLSPRRKRRWKNSVAQVAAFPWRRVNSCTRLLTSTRCLNISEGRTLTQCTSCCHSSETLCAQHRNMEQPLCKN